MYYQIKENRMIELDILAIHIINKFKLHKFNPEPKKLYYFIDSCKFRIDRFDYEYLKLRIVKNLKKMIMEKHIQKILVDY